MFLCLGAISSQQCTPGDPAWPAGAQRLALEPPSPSPKVPGDTLSFVLAVNKAHVLALNPAHVLRLNKADVLALNKAHVLRLNNTCPVFRTNTKVAAFGAFELALSALQCPLAVLSSLWSSLDAFRWRWGDFELPLAPLGRPWAPGTCPTRPRTCPTIRCHQLRLGTSLPHAPGVRMT